MQRYFRNLYDRTMRESYNLAYREIIAAIRDEGTCLDCGANEGNVFEKLSARTVLTQDRYYGIEWDAASASKGREKGLNIKQGNLNQPLPYDDAQFTCIFGLSVLEHLLNGCRYLSECYRTLETNGTLVLLTPNISTYFTAALLLAGKMPSSGPHPDSNRLVKSEEVFKVSASELEWDTESDMPVHRHLVVFSFSVLRKYLHMIGFSEVTGHGFGLYPFPNFLQPALEKIDPYHCHQMVFVCRK